MCRVYSAHVNPASLDKIRALLDAAQSDAAHRAAFFEDKLVTGTCLYAYVTATKKRFCMLI
jgi:hypothetical protein